LQTLAYSGDALITPVSVEATMSVEPVNTESFPRKSKTDLEALLRAKGAKPLKSVDEFMVPGVFASDEEVDEFITAVREWRDASIA
jgi:hypothetical protein